MPATASSPAWVRRGKEPEKGAEGAGRATASWANVLAGIKRDGWTHQARAEQGGSGGPAKVLGAMLIVAMQPVLQVTHPEVGLRV